MTLSTKKSSKSKKKSKTKAEVRYIDDTICVVGFSEELSAGIMEDGTLIDCFQVICRDLEGASESRMLLSNLSWDKLYKTYPGDLKIVSFYYPADTSRQQAYVEHILGREQNPIYRRLAQEKLEELAATHQNVRNREFALFFYAKDAAEYQDNYIAIWQTLAGGLLPLISKMEAEKKKDLFFRLNNKNHPF